jgi:hypothetical protein
MTMGSKEKNWPGLTDAASSSKSQVWQILSRQMDAILHLMLGTEGKTA